MGGGYFPFFTENRPQKHKKHAFLHTSQANGGGSSPPRPPLATLLITSEDKPIICASIAKRGIFYSTRLPEAAKKTTTIHTRR